MTTPCIIRARHVRACVARQRKLGHSVGTHLERAGIPADCLDDDAGVVPTSYFARFLSAACSASELSAFCFGAAPADLRGYPGLQHEILETSNLIEAFDRDRLGATELSGLRLRVASWASKTWIYAAPDGTCLERLGWSAYLLRPMIEIARAAAGPGWWPRSVQLPSAHTVRMAPLDLPACVDVKLRSDRVAMEIPEQLLYITTERDRSPIDELDRAREEHAELPTDLAGTVRLLLKSYMGKRPLSISEVASLAGCSVRSLQRELQKAGCSFSGLLQEARYLHSVPLLINSDAPITDLAYELGYSDPAHFTRAFQRLSGTSPSAFRRLANAPA